MCVIVRRHHGHCSQLPISDAWGRCFLPSSCRLTTALQEVDIAQSYSVDSSITHSDTTSCVSLHTANLEAANANMCAVIDGLEKELVSLQKELEASKSREVFLEAQVTMHVSGTG